MGENSKIEWCDHTWNPWIGCTQVSPACDHCYAMVMMDHRYGKAKWGTGQARVRTSLQNWNEPLRWERAAAASGRIETVFCLSLGDIWDNEVDPAWRRNAFAVMERTPHLIYLLLSKRIGNAVKMALWSDGGSLLPQNAALGATMVNQSEWDRDIQKLLEAGRTLGARFTFASVEPMLGGIDAQGRFPDWVICGGESGPNARPMHPDWVRSLRDQCQANGTAFHFKQWGDWSPHLDRDEEDPDWRAPYSQWERSSRFRFLNLAGGCGFHGDRLHVMRHDGKKAAGRLLDGREWNEVPCGAKPKTPDGAPTHWRPLEDA